MGLREEIQEEENVPGFMPEHVVDGSILISTAELLQPMSSVFPTLMNFKVGKKLLRQK